MTLKIERYGSQPDIPDRRYLMYSAQACLVKKLPVKVDLRNQLPALYNKGQLGSCKAKQLLDMMMQNVSLCETTGVKHVV